MKIIFALVFLSSLSLAADPAKCPVKLVPGTSLKSNSKLVKKIMFKDKFCFQVGENLFTETTPFKEFLEKLLCNKDYDVEKDVKFLPCSGVDLIVDGMQGTYKIKGLRVKPLEPVNL